MSISHCSLPRLQDWNTAELQNRVSGTRFAFRVFDDLCRVTYDEEQGFKSRTNGPDKLCFHTSAAHHVDRSFQVQSPWISASRRWNWALWEMRRRSRQYADNCHIRVAVIDVYALLNKLDGSARSNPHIYHALELLDPDLLDRLGWKSTWSDRLPSQLQNFSNMADEILFLRHIPSSAVVSVIALDDIVGDVPGYGTGWLGSPSFRDSHAAMCSNHFSCSNWDPNLKAREYVDFALALLRPTYKDLYTGTWLLFFELVRDSSLWGDLGDFGISEAHEKANWEKMDPMACLMGGMSTLSVETPTTAKCDYSAKQHGAIARNFQIQIKIFSGQATRMLSALKAEVSKQSVVLELAQLLAEEASAAENCPIERDWSPAESGNCRPLILATAAQLLDPCHMVVSPDITHQLDSIRRNIERFKQRSRSLATSLLFSNLVEVPAADWTRLQRRVKKAVEAKVSWLEEILGVLERSGK